MHWLVWCWSISIKKEYRGKAVDCVESIWSNAQWAWFWIHSWPPESLWSQIWTYWLIVIHDYREVVTDNYVTYLRNIWICEIYWYREQHLGLGHISRSVETCAVNLIWVNQIRDSFLSKARAVTALLAFSRTWNYLLHLSLWRIRLQG